MVLKLAKQFHMSTFMSSRGRKGILRKNDEIYDAVHGIVFYQSCYFIMMSDQIKLALFLGIID